MMKTAVLKSYGELSWEYPVTTRGEIRTPCGLDVTLPMLEELRWYRLTDQEAIKALERKESIRIWVWCLSAYMFNFYEE